MMISKKTFLSLFLLLGLITACTKDEVLEKDPQPEEQPKEEDESSYHLQAVGQSAAELLTQEEFEALQVNLVYVEGYAPTAQTLENLEAFLQERLHKPQGIHISKTAISSPGLAPYSIADIQQVEKDFRTGFNKDKTLAVFVFVTDGSYSENENVLGVAYRNTSLALFGSKMQQYSGGVGQPSQSLLETTVMNHEFGHIMGLVNVGTPPQTDHQDTAHGKHCDVDGCLMYWTAETGDVVSNLVGLSKAPSLDPQCIADLQAKGGK
ncbi:peptidase [Nafulsella turpanensis]|uniref:peptidase n=1 Tax=Nafulsella turpanensis TaxID=1265690 RepID=UPI00034A5EE5|nr:peptidase [Nafulsella turpanensis]